MLRSKAAFVEDNKCAFFYAVLMSTDKKINNPKRHSYIQRLHDWSQDKRGGSMSSNNKI
jgi:hypothetical protein